MGNGGKNGMDMIEQAKKFAQKQKGAVLLNKGVSRYVKKRWKGQETD